MEMKIDPVPQGLDDGDDAGSKRAPGQGLELTDQGPEGAEAKVPQQPALVLGEGPQHPGDRENHLTVWDIQQKRFPHQLAPLLKALGMGGGAEPPGLAGKHQKMLRPAARTADAGKPAARVPAVQTSLRGAKRRSNLMHWRYMMRSPRSLRSLVMAFDGFLDNRPEEAILLLETAPVFGEELVEMMKKHPVEDGAFRMSGTGDSCHGQDKNPTNGPEAGRIPQETNFPW